LFLDFCKAFSVTPGRGGKADSSRGELSALLLTAVRYLGGSVDTVTPGRGGKADSSRGELRALLVEELATMSEESNEGTGSGLSPELKFPALAVSMDS
jgi:hypothetical protein